MEAAYHGSYSIRQSLSCPSNHYGVNQPHHRIFSFCDIVMESRLAAVNRLWNHAIKNNLLLEKEEESIKGHREVYSLLDKVITREQADKLFLQTGMELPFKPGDNVVRNFFIGDIGRHQQVFNGGVFIGCGKTSNEYVAVKKMCKDECIKKEMLFQSIFAHSPFILRHHDFSRTVNSDGKVTYYQVQKLAGLGAIDKIIPLIQSLKDLCLKEQLIYLIIESVLQGLKTMHHKGVCHLDMKPANLVVQADGTVLIIDLEVAAKMTAKNIINAKEESGDDEFFAPERWISLHDRADGICNGIKIDVWAVGLILLSLGGIDISPFGQKEMEKVLTSVTIKNGTLRELIRAFHTYVEKTIGTIEALKNPVQDSFWDLASGLMQCDPAKRLDTSMALRHPWIKKMQSVAGWKEAAKQRLCELVQSLRREKRLVLSPNVIDQISDFSPLSPQDLPLPHFVNYVERPQLQEMILKCILGGAYEQVSVLACSGMGGVGKTQLLTYILHHPKVHHHFGLKLWFRNSDSRSLLETQCHFLAQELGLVDKTAPNEVALRRLHDYLETYSKKYGKPWLAIFDNAEYPALLAPFLPRASGQVIVTTRSALWREAIPIDVLTPEEGISLINKLLQRDDPLNGSLGQALGYLPLGLAQACAYIRSQQIPLATYLEQLEKAPALLASDERLYGKKLPHSLMSLWQMTFTTLASSCPEALTLLDQLAYLAPDVIPQALLNKLGSAAQTTLEQYALLQTNISGSTVHRLLQLVIRSQHQVDKQQTALENVMRGLDATYIEPNTKQARQTNAQLLAHGEYVLAHYDALSEEVQTRLYAPLADTCSWLGHLQGELGKPYINKDLSIRALEAAERAYGKDHSKVALFLSNLGRAWADLGDPYEAIDYHKRALAIDEETYGKEHLNVAVDLNNLGNVEYEFFPRKAIGYYERALAIYEKIKGKDHPCVAISLNLLSSAWQDLGDAYKAIDYSERALLIFEKTYGKEDPHRGVADSFNNLGAAWADLGDARQAIGYHERALAIIEKIYGKEHPYVASYLNVLGNAEYEFNPRIAIGYYERELAIVEKTHGKDHINVSKRLFELGNTWEDLGDSRKAISYYKRALAIDEKAYGKEHPYVAYILNSLGNTWKKLGKARKAIRCYERALVIFKETYGKNHTEVVLGLFNLGLVWKDLGDRKKAIAFFQQAYTLSLRLPEWEYSPKYKEELDQAIADNSEKHKQAIGKCLIM